MASFGSRFMPCLECGASVEQDALEAHACEIDRKADFELFQLRCGVAAFEDDVGAFLESARGRFELWYAARERRRSL